MNSALAATKILPKVRVGPCWPMDIRVIRRSSVATSAADNGKRPQYGQRDEPAQMDLSQCSQRKGL